MLAELKMKQGESKECKFNAEIVIGFLKND